MRLINGQANKQTKLVHQSPAVTSSAEFSPTLRKQWKITVHLEKSDVMEIMKKKRNPISLIQTPQLLPQNKGRLVLALIWFSHNFPMFDSICLCYW